MASTVILWIVFAVLVVVCLVIDLAGHRSAKEPSTKSSLAWAALWIGLAVAFGFGVSPFIGKDATYSFFTAYLLEKALSVDNLFVFIVIFGFFGIPRANQHRILFWGILGALVMRAVFIFLGVALVSRFHFLLYLFGAFLVYTAIKLLFAKSEEVEPTKSIGYRLAKLILPISESADNGRFFVVEKGRRMVTKLLVVLVVVEATDVVFALDSIPAVLSITTDSFVVYTSNIFAILGLRALYFLLAGLLAKMRYLNIGLSAVLAFIGGKMIVSGFLPKDFISPKISLLVVGGLLTVAIAASLIADSREKRASTNRCGSPS